MLHDVQHAPELLTRRILVLVGEYGAGKTPVSLSMAIHKAESDFKRLGSPWQV